MKRPLNVLHVLGTAQPEGSGIAKIVASLAQGLNPLKFKVHACFLQPNGPLVAELRSVGVTAHCVPWNGGIRDPVGATRFWRQLQSEEFALVHQHEGARSIRNLIRLGSKAKIVVHRHRRILEKIEAGEIPVVVRRADAIIAVSKSIADQLPGQQVHVVYSGVAASECQVRIKSSIKSTVVIGTACRLVQAKGVRDLISAYAALSKNFPSVRLEIAGSGPEMSSLSKAVQDLGISGSVTLLGWRDDLRQLLANWDVFVLPSYDEGLPTVILEAMAEGLPVIATNVGGVPEQVENESTGYLVEPGDVDALQKALIRLVTSPEDRSRFGEAGRIRAQTEFSVEKMIEQIESIYDELVRKQ